MKLTKLGLNVSDIWPIGKHKGKLIKDLPEHYLFWVLFETDMDKFLKNKVKFELYNREEVDSLSDLQDLYENQIEDREASFREDIGWGDLQF